MDIRKYLSDWQVRYRKDLTENILPFWLKYGLDKKNGGVYTCLDRDGSLMDSTKSVWFQGRFGFIMAYAYNNILKCPEYLEASRLAIDFIEKHCFDSDGRMFFEVTEEGVPLRKRRYVFSETFATIAMSEYAIASKDVSYAVKALELLNRIIEFINTPGVLEPKYLPSLKARGHSATMILINTASRVREVINDPSVTSMIDSSINDLEKYFIKEDYHALLETVGLNGEFIDTIQGRMINPGHCIETSWFLLEESRYRGWDEHLTDLALKIFNWSWDWGWDKQYGGIINFRDCKNYPCQDYSQDMKFWWPQTEAIIATLYAYLATGDKDYIEKHKQVSKWTYSHFPDKEFGEWYGYLHRDGTVAQPAKGNIFKGPFHIPRMMIKSSLLIDNILKNYR